MSSKLRCPWGRFRGAFISVAETLIYPSSPMSSHYGYIVLFRKRKFSTPLYTHRDKRTVKSISCCWLQTVWFVLCALHRRPRKFGRSGFEHDRRWKVYAVLGPQMVNGRICPRLENPPHGSVRYNADNTVATFLCEHGYKLEGARTVTCFFGTWSNDTPRCIPYGPQLVNAGACPRLEDPPHGSVRYNSDNTVATFLCDHGYTLEGARTLFCFSVKWSSDSPKCILRVRTGMHAATAPTTSRPHHGVAAFVDRRRNHTEPVEGTIPLACQVLSHIPNGYVILFRTRKHQVTYLCKKGFRLEGNSTAFCIQSVWSSPPPRCIPSHGGVYPTIAPTIQPETAVNPCVYDYGGCDHVCLNDNGTPHCQCMYGYKADGKRCVDIDECLDKKIRCHTCRNTPGSYHCLCKDGFKPDADQISCVDIDECLVDNGGCGDGCRNTYGSYHCYCTTPGTTLASDGRSCVYVVPGTRSEFGVPDPCASNNGRGPCEDTCIRRGNGRYACSCSKPGVRLHTDRRTCVDHDECRDDNFGCMHNCHNTVGSAYCSCDQGYQLHQDGKQCVDINECDQPSVCRGECINTLGSYRCLEPVAEDAEELSSSGDGPALLTPVGVEDELLTVSPSPSCPKGMAMSLSGICEDINECQEGSSGCSQMCQNTVGSYKCGCRRGYRLGQDESTCHDIDECHAYPHYRPCADICTNVPGSFHCSCNPGRILMRNGQCQDCPMNSYKVPELDLCQDCPQRSHTNGTGKASLSDCICDPGFAGNPAAGNMCKDIDECDEGLLNCSQICINTLGSAYCACKPGFTLAPDATTCVDIDECAGKTHSCDQDCLNTVGGYECSCGAGYELSHEDKHKCIDIDECAVKNGGCSQGCVNIPGGYYCKCDAGYRIASDLHTCIGVTCPALMEVANARRNCTADATAGVGTHCFFKCHKGYTQEGPTSILCLENGSWSDNLPRCTPRSCPALRDPDNGRVFPSRCLSDSDNTVLSKCVFTCDTGYKMNGKVVNVCLRDGSWKNEVPTCSKAESGVSITCPADIVVSLPSGSDTVLFDLPAPLSTNVGLDSVEVHPKWIENYTGEFPFGTTEVTYVIRHPDNGTEDSCTFVVDVQDNEPPKVVQCPGTVVAYATVLEGAPVTWDEPEFEDNVELDTVEKSEEPGSTFTVGEHIVHYIARDLAGNEATCQFDVHVKRKECVRPREIEHGELECYDWIQGVVCEPVCDDGYAFPSNVSYFYTCDLAGVWQPRSWVPECSEYTPTERQDCLPGSEYFEELEGESSVCVECPPGMYWEKEAAKCSLCEPGFYQDEYGQTSCKPCPATRPQTIPPLLEEQCFAD